MPGLSFPQFLFQALIQMNGAWKMVCIVGGLNPGPLGNESSALTTITPCLSQKLIDNIISDSSKKLPMYLIWLTWYAWEIYQSNVTNLSQFKLCWLLYLLGFYVYGLPELFKYFFFRSKKSVIHTFAKLACECSNPTLSPKKGNGLEILFAGLNSLVVVCFTC